jgi:hypothetical protein
MIPQILMEMVNSMPSIPPFSKKKRTLHSRTIGMQMLFGAYDYRWHLCGSSFRHHASHHLSKNKMCGRFALFGIGSFGYELLHLPETPLFESYDIT